MSLWDDVVAAYGRPGVKAACLTLQDEHGHCVSYLLWAAWTALHGRFVHAPGLTDCAQLARAWETTRLAPARAKARDLKRAIGDNDEDPRHAALRDLQSQALDLERQLLSALEARTPACGADILLVEGLRAAAEAWGEPAPRQLLDVLAGAFSPA